MREYTPNVIEPSFGIGRILYSLLEHSYYTRPGDEQRSVFRFPASMAPTKVLVVPISHQDSFAPFIKQIGIFEAQKLMYSEWTTATRYFKQSR